LGFRCAGRGDERLDTPSFCMYAGGAPEGALYFWDIVIVFRLDIARVRDEVVVEVGGRSDKAQRASLRR